MKNAFLIIALLFSFQASAQAEHYTTYTNEMCERYHHFSYDTLFEIEKHDNKLVYRLKDTIVFEQHLESLLLHTSEKKSHPEYFKTYLCTYAIKFYEGIRDTVSLVKYWESRLFITNKIPGCSTGETAYRKALARKLMEYYFDRGENETARQLKKYLHKNRHYIPEYYKNSVKKTG